MSTNALDLKSTVERECKRWGESYAELRQSYADFVADDTEYLCHPDMPLFTGSGPALEAITGFHDGFGVEAIEVEWVELEQIGNTVWNERIDYMIGKDGKRFLAIPIAGYFRFDDSGKLVAWHDYWDMRPLLATAAPAE